MPLYDFELRVGKKVVGKVMLPLRVNERDRVTIHRAEIPDSLAISGSATDPTLQRNQVLHGFKRVEQRLGTNGLRQRLGDMSIETVKRAWATP